ncbi:hypothetical protein CALCODRAFT_519545 [Calocera cornea HHB12733]|uniref:DUF6535 domain-containing protein n=1 Tax=Calocera cornea HHB12733 TaxID=1353952 RepID=A0A165E6S0_9BASI|nr:hypothetical protein CALCODRAFT_519545 [Calocera cornea HHB12733]
MLDEERFVSGDTPTASETAKPPTECGTYESELPPGMVQRNFTDDFPKGMGMGDDAEIWTKYNEFATKYDKELLETVNGGMENLLVFAALFSAVVTAFLMMSLQLLFVDQAGVMVDAITTVSAQLAALGSASSSMPPKYQSQSFTIPTSALYINALWIISLSISLFSSVLAMLVKQWLRAYTAELPATPHQLANQRQFRYDGLLKWQLRGIAGSLPLMLQVSVALFLTGFVVYLWDISPGLRWLLFSLLLSGGIAYIGLAAAPVFWIDCPYKSPLTQAFDVVLCYSLRGIAGLLSTKSKASEQYYRVFGLKIPYLSRSFFTLKPMKKHDSGKQHNMMQHDSEKKHNLAKKHGPEKKHDSQKEEHDSKTWVPERLWVPLMARRARQWVVRHQEDVDERAIVWLSSKSCELATAKSIVTACLSWDRYSGKNTHPARIHIKPHRLTPTFFPWRDQELGNDTVGVPSDREASPSNTQDRHAMTSLTKTEDADVA